MTRTRLRPKHRRALLAALPPLADELRDGRLVALAAETLRERAADLALNTIAIEQALGNAQVAVALIRGFEAAVGEPWPTDPAQISSALDRLRDRLADRGAEAPPPSLPDREAERLAAEVKAARDEAEGLRRDLQDRRAEVARLQAAVASPEGSGAKRRLRALEQALAEAREGARADAAAADSAIALLDAALAGMANLLGEGPPPAEADLPLGAADLLARLRARLAASEPAHAAER